MLKEPTKVKSLNLFLSDIDLIVSEHEKTGLKYPVLFREFLRCYKLVKKQEREK